MRKLILLVVMLIGLTAIAQERKVEYEISFDYNSVEYITSSGDLIKRVVGEGKLIFYEYDTGDVSLNLGDVEYSLSHAGNMDGYAKYVTSEGVTDQDVVILLYHNVLQIRINSSYFYYYINGYTELSYDG